MFPLCYPLSYWGVEKENPLWPTAESVDLQTYQLMKRNQRRLLKSLAQRAGDWMQEPMTRWVASLSSESAVEAQKTEGGELAV